MRNRIISIPKLNENKPHHVSLDAVTEFLEAIEGDRDVEFIPYNKLIDSRYPRALWRIQHPIINKLLTAKKEAIYFSIAMGIDAEPASLEYRIAKQKALYLFDAWPSKYEKIKSFVERTSTHLLFVSAKQSYEDLSRLLPLCKVVWCPEGCSDSRYKFKHYKQRNIDILALGRKNDYLHDCLVSQEIDKKFTYLFEKQKGKIIFPTRQEFIEGLSDTKILICYPRSVTHPQEAGHVETMTNRYLQGMASKVLMVGKCPLEMKKLFGYEPVINLNEKNPGDHIEDILNNYEQYLPLIERNYLEFCQKHSWKNRWHFIKSHIVEELFK